MQSASPGYTQEPKFRSCKCLTGNEKKNDKIKCEEPIQEKFQPMSMSMSVSMSMLCHVPRHYTLAMQNSFV